MTDRIRFEKKAIANGCTINLSESHKLVITSANGAMTTTYIFDDSGNFIDWDTRSN